MRCQPPLASRLRPALGVRRWLKWIILGGTLFFILKTFKDRWEEVTAVRIQGEGWTLLIVAGVITLIAHVWSGWVWTWILKSCKQPITTQQGLKLYLRTNIAKYLPGNIWHYYGRIKGVQNAGGSLAIATLTVLLEPLLMAAAALIIALIGLRTWGLEILGLILILLIIHPNFLNPVLQTLSRQKGNTTTEKLSTYPLIPLLGEIGFVVLRGSGFLSCFWALTPINLSDIPQILAAFSFAWLLGLIVPGAPGGLGVFEATAIALLDDFSGVVVLTIALYRVISILAEVLAAGLSILN
ncbi:MAG: flippase-like domain-containing protein [Prochloron sp. SP5CPC1]|nr:flippase-like domain-containing protein [Candidatus Paraprochloron terpiosi SP5CPC1]